MTTCNDTAYLERTWGTEEVTCTRERDHIGNHLQYARPGRDLAQWANES